MQRSRVPSAAGIRGSRPSLLYQAGRRIPLPVKNSGGAGLPAGLSYVVCGDPLLKAEFLGGLAGQRGDTVYIDLDMMYGGFLRAGVAPAPPAGGLLRIAAAGGEETRRALGRAVSAVSTGGPATVIIDTLNGMYDAAGGASRGEAGADASVMILAMAARHTASRVVVACIAEQRGGEEGEWYLLPGRRKLPVVAEGGGAAWLRLVRGDRPEGGGAGAIGLEPIVPGGVPDRRMHAPPRRSPARPR